MANVKQGTLARATEWWRHLRAEKRTFWKRERRAQTFDAKIAAQQALEGRLQQHHGRRV